MVLKLQFLLYPGEARPTHSDPVYHREREKVNSSWWRGVDDQRPPCLLEGTLDLAAGRGEAPGHLLP